MMRPSFIGMYRSSVKSDEADELVNTYLQRPVAGVITYWLSFTRVTPNQVTFVSTAFGLAAGLLLCLTPPLMPAAAICVYLKDVFDSADGQLARATHRYSRRGRFWDSLGDFVVNTALSAGIFMLLVHRGTSIVFAAAAAVAMWLLINLRVSYQVFYQTSFLHTRGAYLNNRTAEDVREEDRAASDRVTLLLQKIFLVVYGWQDRLIAVLDRRSRRHRGAEDTGAAAQWYADRWGRRLTRCFGMGTEFVALTVCLAVQSIDAYLVLTLVLFTMLWASAIVYRFFFALRSSASISK